MPIISSGEIGLLNDIDDEFSQGGADVSLIDAATAAGISTGDVSMFGFYGLSDAVLSSVSTNTTTSISTSAMTANGNVTNDGGGTILYRGFYFGTSTNYASNSKYTVAGTTGSFSRVFSGLGSGSTRYITAFSINSQGETVGSTVTSSTTQPTVPYTWTKGYSDYLSANYQCYQYPVRNIVGPIWQGGTNTIGTITCHVYDSGTNAGCWNTRWNGGGWSGSTGTLATGAAIPVNRTVTMTNNGSSSTQVVGAFGIYVNNSASGYATSHSLLGYQRFN